MDKRGKAESPRKEADKEVVRIKYEIRDMDVTSEGYLTASKAAKEWATTSQTYVDQRNKLLGILVPSGCAITGMAVGAVVEYTHIIDRLIKRVRDWQSMFHVK